MAGADASGTSSGAGPILPFLPVRTSIEICRSTACASSTRRLDCAGRRSHGGTVREGLPGERGAERREHRRLALVAGMRALRCALLSAVVMFAAACGGGGGGTAAGGHATRPPPPAAPDNLGSSRGA